MLNGVLQIWGGLFYLLNKIFFSRMERQITPEDKRWWRIWAWVVYIIGLPAWLIIFVIEQNWMVMAVELGGFPAMVLGLYIALQGRDDETSVWLGRFAMAAAAVGIGISFYDIGIMTRFTQWAELGVSVGFLVGLPLLAYKHPIGYVCFMIMNVSAGWLMWLQDYPWLMLQQAISLGFVIDAFLAQRRKTETSET